MIKKYFEFDELMLLLFVKIFFFVKQNEKME